MAYVTRPEMTGQLSELAFVPVAAAAEMLGVCRQRVYRMVKTGQLAHRYCTGTLLISRRGIAARVELMVLRRQAHARRSERAIKSR